ncbi:MAG: Zeta toxin family protein [Candidatus Moranbacteria bacterium GW2011_GWE1_36_7]|nr:MAG: Zeta toxin family protein [Candidatus Moranbacteria bacterium GW2011_GWE2_36_40]KKQ12513.1 MAG: Zeta toxin family protein [Candidatus Moranbacteria bacterium GW2011_GWE1_36_7]
MDMDKEEFIKNSRDWIKTNKKEIIKKFANDILPIPNVKPFVIFMAGSPGAGKTETSKNFITEFEQLYYSKSGKKHPSIHVVRIDPDEIREMIPGYDGANAELFQGPASLGVEKVYDYVMKKDLSVIVDGTLASYSVAYKNIEIALRKKRNVAIFYVYQDPLIAWKFTKAREDEDGRHISKARFVEAFFKAKINTNKLKKEFGNRIQVFLIIKNYSNATEKTEFNIENIDNYLKVNYTKQSLMKKIC